MISDVDDDGSGTIGYEALFALHFVVEKDDQKVLSLQASCVFPGQLDRANEQILGALGVIGLQEFLKMMTHKILNRDPKDEILKV